jgi:hypothetical protein
VSMLWEEVEKFIRYIPGLRIIHLRSTADRYLCFSPSVTCWQLWAEPLRARPAPHSSSRLFKLGATFGTSSYPCVYDSRSTDLPCLSLLFSVRLPYQKAKSAARERSRASPIPWKLDLAPRTACPGGAAHPIPTPAISTPDPLVPAPSHISPHQPSSPLLRTSPLTSSLGASSVPSQSPLPTRQKPKRNISASVRSGRRRSSGSRAGPVLLATRSARSSDLSGSDGKEGTERRMKRTFIWGIRTMRRMKGRWGGSGGRGSRSGRMSG